MSVKAAKRGDRQAAKRRAELAGIHAEAKKLGLDDGTYRDLLERVTGQRSAKDLDGQARRKVLGELRRLGGTRPRTEAPSAAWQGAPRDVQPERQPLVSKVGALLADAQRPWTYGHAMARRMFSVSRVEWLRPDQLSRLVAALAIDQKRRKAGGAK